MLEMAFCLFHGGVVGKKVEDISDPPNLVEQELKLSHNICTVWLLLCNDLQDPLTLVE